MENSHIQWTDHTFNPWIGCTKVSPGCLHCYAEALNKRWAGGENWGAGAPRRRTSATNWLEPIKWNTMSERRIALNLETPRPRVFCASLADWLDPEVDIEWLADLLELVHACPFLDWLMLTKRPEEWRARLEAVAKYWTKSGGNTAAYWWLTDWLETKRDARPPLNVWIGTTVEDQVRADLRIPQLMAIPAAMRFLSCEPLLGPLDLEMIPYIGRTFDTPEIAGRQVDWIICGGESGPGARAMDLEWARYLQRQCAGAGVKFFMKQLGGSRDKRGEIEDLPADLQVRQFPVWTGA